MENSVIHAQILVSIAQQPVAGCPLGHSLLGINLHQIVAVGDSSGKQVAVAVGIIRGLDEPLEDQAIISRLGALIL